MRHLGTSIVLLALLAACRGSGGAGDAGLGGARDAARDADDGARDVGPDTGRFCHWDCFGGHRCADGQVTSYAHRPIPCAEWTGECPHSISYTCERGCRTDGVTVEDSRAPPVSMCEEGRPKVAGDPCEDDSYCVPPSVTGSGGSLDRHHLTCDLAAHVCVDAPDPTPADWLAPCGADVSHLLDPDDGGWVFGYVDDPTCSGGVCVVFERDTCVENECSLRCETDDDCPDGSACEDRLDRTPRDGGSGDWRNVCVPYGSSPDCR